MKRTSSILKITGLKAYMINILLMLLYFRRTTSDVQAVNDLLFNHVSHMERKRVTQVLEGKVRFMTIIFPLV